jgi:hypothetical protein
MGTVFAVTVQPVDATARAESASNKRNALTFGCSDAATLRNSMIFGLPQSPIQPETPAAIFSKEIYDAI